MKTDKELATELMIVVVLPPSQCYTGTGREVSTMVDLITLIKSIPMDNYENIGLAVGWDKVYQASKSYGFENQNALNFELRKLSSAGLVELFCMYGFDENLIYAVRVK